MKKLLIFILTLLIFLTSANAYAGDSPREIIDGIFSHVQGGLELQAWVDGPVSDAAGSAMDNYVIALRRSGIPFDSSAYVRAAADKLHNTPSGNPVSRQRTALALISCGAIEQLPPGIVDETAGKLGVMSYVYALHLLNNGAPSELWTREALLQALLEVQKDDGGWAVMGNYGDVDVTAMVLHALSVFSDEAQLKESIERSLAFLSDRQLESGGFSSNGRENAESACQVLIAFASLGIDPEHDARFIKGENSVLDALLTYRLANGAFAHLPGDESANDTAAVQALQALLALELSPEPYFDFAKMPEAKPVRNAALPSWKIYALAGVGLLLMIGIVFALTRKRGRMKQLVFVVMIAALMAGAVCFIDVQSASDYYKADVSGTAADGSVYLSIRCDTVAGSKSDGSTPENGVILARTEMPFEQGDSVFDVLTDAARRFEIHMEHEGGTEGMAYVCGINHLYEYAHGDLSGWIYSVNGEQLSVGCGSCIVKDGDEIIWQYTLNLGEDLK